jgi:hypothetical protein
MLGLWILPAAFFGFVSSSNIPACDQLTPIGALCIGVRYRDSVSFAHNLAWRDNHPPDLGNMMWRIEKQCGENSCNRDGSFWDDKVFYGLTLSTDHIGNWAKDRLIGGIKAALSSNYNLENGCEDGNCYDVLTVPGHISATIYTRDSVNHYDSGNEMTVEFHNGKFGGDICGMVGAWFSDIFNLPFSGTVVALICGLINGRVVIPEECAGIETINGTRRVPGKCIEYEMSKNYGLSPFYGKSNLTDFPSWYKTKN